MRRKDRQITDKDIINEILLKSDIARIALFDNEYPYIIPMNYGYKDNALYFHCAPEGKKLDLIKRNNNVAFEIEYHSEIMKYDKSCKWTTKYRSVLGKGNIFILENKTEITEALNVIMQHHNKFDNKYDEKYFGRMKALKLEIKELSAKQGGDWA